MTSDMKPGAFLRILLVVWVVRVSAELAVVDDTTGAEPFRIRQTSQFKFYGKLKGRQSIDASAVFLEGRDLCSPKRDVVEGKIVVAARGNTFCDLEHEYRALDAKGAIALVSVAHHTGRPGLWCYRHLSWDPRARADDALVLVEATKKSFVLADEEEGDDDEAGGDIEEQFGRIMDEWSARADAGDLHLRLAPPWDTYYQDFYESIWWLLPFRVVLPSYALYTSVFAALQSEQYRRRGAEWTPGRVICFMEAPILLLIAVALACGLYVSVAFLCICIAQCPVQASPTSFLSFYLFSRLIAGP